MIVIYLQHYGIKGQKWGVRRYQNPDGTLTDLGKKRRYENSDGTLTELGKRQYLKTWNRMSRDVRDSRDYSRHPEKYDPAIILNPSESIKEVSRTKIKEKNYSYSF